MKSDFDPMPDAKKLIKYLRCSIIETPDEEADDVLATFCNQMINSDVIVDIITTDRDLWQCAWQRNIRIFDPIKKKIILRSDLDDKFGLRDHTKIPLWKAMFGDSSDNIKAAIPRLQKKMIVPLINESDGTVKSLVDLLVKKSHIFTGATWLKIEQGIRENAIEINYNIV